MIAGHKAMAVCPGEPARRVEARCCYAALGCTAFFNRAA